MGQRVNRLGVTLPWVFLRAGSEEKYVQSQYVHERIADVAIDLYASACVLARLDHLRTTGNGDAAQTEADLTAGRYFLALARRRIDANFAALKDNDDAQTTAAANATLRLG